MTWALTTSGNAIAKAGVHANATIIADGSTLYNWCTLAEGYICEQTGIDWVTNYSSVDTQIKNALSDAVSSKIALNIITYDPTAYFSREQDALLNLNDGIVEKSIAKLKEFGKGTKLQAPNG